MNIGTVSLFWPYAVFAGLLFVIGLYCVFVTFNLIRALIGLEILIKAVTLLLIVAGHVTHHEAMAQSLVITLIVIEAVVVIAVAGVIIGIRESTGSLDTRKITELKG